MVVFDRSGRSWFGAVFLVGLAACQGTDGGRASLSAGIAPADVPIAIESIEGAPPSVTAQLTEAISAEAAARQIALVPRSGQARYRLKGYLTAYPAEGGGTTVAFVWDVYDAANKRTRRVEGANTASSAGGSDPWAGVDAATLRQVASQGMNDVAGFLAASAPGPAQVDTAKAPAEAKPLGFTTR
jgi:hypothetical protein